MARKIKAPLIMPDGAVVRDLDELKIHFDLPVVMEYYENGKLAEWLDNYLYTEEATRVRELMRSSAPDLGPMLCDILGVAYTKPDDSEEATDRHKRFAQLRQYTTDESILAAVDHVAFSQEDLVKLLEKEPDIKEIYLCGERFAIPKDWKGITYIGVGAKHPKVYNLWWSGATVKQVEVSDSEEFTPDYFWRSLAEQGNAIAQNELGNCCFHANNSQDAIKWFLMAAKQGNVNAQRNLDMCCREREGVTESQEKAFKWFLDLAKQGNADAQYYVGKCYSDGRGVEKDFVKAFNWYLKAAKQRNVNAQLRLACCYSDGKGIDKNEEESFKWWLKAAGQGERDAQREVGDRYFDGRGVKRDSKKGFNWYWKAAKQRDDQAQRVVINCYKTGRGVKKDMLKAAGLTVIWNLP